MRLKLALTLIALLCVASTASAAVRWEKSAADAVEQAKKLGRPIVVFWAKNPASLVTADTAVADTAAAEYIDKFVWLKVDLSAEPALGKSLGIDAYLAIEFKPHTPVPYGFVFTDKDGRIYGRLPAAPRTGVLGRMLKGVNRAFGPIPNDAALKDIKNKLDRALELGQAGEDHRGSQLLQQIVETGYRGAVAEQAASALGRSARARVALAREQAAVSWQVQLDADRPRVKTVPPRRPMPKDPHVWHKCETCKNAVAKAMFYVKKRVHDKKATWYGGFLGGWSTGAAMLIEGRSERELNGWVVPRAIKTYLPKSRTDFQGYHNWFQAMSGLTLTEYSLRYGLHNEVRGALAGVHQTAVEFVEDTGGWNHSPRRGEDRYASDISSIGCFYYSTFLEMEAMGMNAEPGLTLARGYLESVSDGNTIGYGTPSRHGGPGSSGKDGLILLGLYASGRGDDPFAQSLGAWLANPANHTPQRGHAYGMMQFLGASIGLHRMGPEYYDPFVKKWLHALISVQRPDGSMPHFPNDSKEDVAGVVKALKAAEVKPDEEWEHTGALAAMILMTEPYSFSGLPTKPRRSTPNAEAFEIAEKAYEAREYAKARLHYAMVLPPGDGLENLHTARRKLRDIDEASRREQDALCRRETVLLEKFADDKGSTAAVTAYKQLIADYSDFITAYQSFAAEKLASKRLPALKAHLKRLEASEQSPEQATEKPVAEKPMRTWTDTSGQFSVKAKLLEVTDGSVFLRRADGKKLKIPAAKLSAKDREYLREIDAKPD